MRKTPTTSRIAWRRSYRIVPSRYPPVGIFDAIADPADLAAIWALESMTNARLQNERGQLDLVPVERWVSGPGTTPIMAAFTHINPNGSRFTDGSYGVYYAGRDRDTAITETVFHRERFLAETCEPATVLEMRCYIGAVRATLHDLRGGWRSAHAPNSYASSQMLARRLRTAGSDGLVYDSVRHAGGQCVALFYPNRVAPVIQGPHLFYHWDGARITDVSERLSGFP